MTAHPEDLLRRADVVAWLRAKSDSTIAPIEVDDRMREALAIDAVATAIEAGAVAPIGVVDAYEYNADGTVGCVVFQGADGSLR